MNIVSNSADQTMDLGRTLAQRLRPGDIICLFGDLGTGKTTLVKGIAEGLKISKNKVNSPTFVLLNIYEGKLPLFHFDFYRLNEPSEIASTGYDEFLYDDGIAVIEWAERMSDLLPGEHLSIRLTSKGENERALEIAGKGKRYARLVKDWNKP